MLTLEELEPGSSVTHKNTGLRYQIVEAGEEEVLLSPEASDMEDLMVPLGLFQQEFTLTGAFRAPRSGGGGRGRGRRNAPARVATGPKSRGRIKKMVRDRGFGFIRGEDGKEVFFHRSGMNGSEYDSMNEGDSVEYVIQEGPRGARAEHVRTVTAEPAP